MKNDVTHKDIHSSSHSAAQESASVTGLFRQLADDVTGLFTKEVALAKNELRHSIQEAKAATTALVSGGAVLYAGFLFLLLAAVIGLATVVEAWLAALIVGSVVALVGFVLVESAKKKFTASSFKPEQTMQSLRKDRDTVRGAI